MMTKVVHVAVGVIRQGDYIFIAKRPDHLHQGGLWEFPGGKVERGESVTDALVRELREELDIIAEEFSPLIQVQHEYGDKTVFLDVWVIEKFSGEAKGCEGQEVRWVNVQNLGEFDFPEANRPIINAIKLPEQIAIIDGFENKGLFEQKVLSALAKGANLIQLRAPKEEKEFKRYSDLALGLCGKHEAQLLFNTSPYIYQSIGVGGLHVNRHILQQIDQRPVKAEILFGASCHNLEEIRQAERLNADYVFLSPVLETRSHPEVEPLGWGEFSAIVKQAKVPVYALGGLTIEDIETAKRYGGQGIAGISTYLGDA